MRFLIYWNALEPVNRAEMADYAFGSIRPTGYGLGKFMPLGIYSEHAPP
jgi:hypothetical protein